MLTFHTQASAAEAEAIARLLDGGWCDILDGPRPPGPNARMTSQRVLASLRFSTPASTTPIEEETVLFDPLVPDLDARGTHGERASWFRTYRADHQTPVFDGSVGETAGADLILTSTWIPRHARVEIADFLYHVPSEGLR